MSWQTEMVRILRYLIADIDTDAPLYDNGRLEEVILVSSQLVLSELDFSVTYSVDVDGQSLSPDPIDNNDNNFVNLVCLRGAILVLGSEYKTSAGNSVRVVDGPSTIDMTDVTRNAKMLYDDALKAYNLAKFNYKAGNSVSGQSILTPYTFGGVYGGWNGT